MSLKVTIAGPSMAAEVEPQMMQLVIVVTPSWPFVTPISLFRNVQWVTVEWRSMRVTIRRTWLSMNTQLVTILGVAQGGASEVLAKRAVGTSPASKTHSTLSMKVQRVTVSDVVDRAAHVAACCR